MSTTAMWLLLAVVIVVILFGSVLYKRIFTTKELALTGVMAALSLVAYLFFRVPFYGGSSFHLGNTFTALTALLLDGMIDRMEAELGQKATVVATGGLARCIVPICQHEILLNEDLLLNGLAVLYEKNK